MPIQQKTPQQWACNQCDWRHEYVIKSDVLIPKPEKCPKCGNEKLVLQPTSFLNKLQNLWR